MKPRAREARSSAYRPGATIGNLTPDLTPPPGSGQYQQPAIDKLASTLDQHVAKARESLRSTNDEYLLTTNWRLKAGGQVPMNQPVPAIYGPSADDQRFA